MSPLDADAQAALDFALAASRQYLYYELAGIFWLWAEFMILCAMAFATGALEGKDISGRKLIFGIGFSAFTALSPLSLSLMAHEFYTGRIMEAVTSEDLRFLAHTYAGALRYHLLLWSSFVALWVILETMIVWMGVRAYRRFSALCRAVLATAVVVLALALTAPVHAQQGDVGPMMTALLQKDAELQPLRNAVYLYLRIAGVVWIAVEWVAAVLLWRGQSLLWRVARAHAHD
jgi:hypothetical protein